MLTRATRSTHDLSQFERDCIPYTLKGSLTLAAIPAGVEFAARILQRNHGVPAMPIPEQSLQATLKAVKTRDLAATEVLFRQGDPAAAIFGVEDGRIRLVRHTVDDHLAVLHTVGKGEMVAEAALFSETYHCDAVASTPTRVRVYPKSETLQALLKDPAMAVSFMSSLAHQVQDLRTRLEQRNIRSARERVTQFLRLSADARDGSVPVKGTLMDLAGEMGLSHEALYRTLATLESEKTITRTKNKIVLHLRRAV